MKTNKDILSDEAFKASYEEALRQVQSEEDLSLIAALPRDRLIEWVNSPAKIKPFLLKKWKTEVPISKRIKDTAHDIQEQLESSSTRFKQKAEKDLADWKARPWWKKMFFN